AAAREPRLARRTPPLHTDWLHWQQTARMRVTIRVRPGASVSSVGGAYGDALVVRVHARAVDGQATEAALAAVANAFGVPRRSTTLVSGATSRTKVVEVEGADPGRLDQLLNGGPAQQLR